MEKILIGQFDYLVKEVRIHYRKRAQKKTLITFTIYLKI